MPNAPTVAITGATGFIGSHLVAHFAGCGWQVLALSRSVPGTTLPGVKYVKYDLRDRVDDRLFSGVDFLVHGAYIENEIHANVEGTKRLLEASRQHGLKRKVFISSVSAHEQALSRYGKHKYLCEQLFDAEADSIVRPALVLGHGGLFQRMSAYLRNKPVIPLISGGRQPMQIVWIHDLLLAIEKILISDSRGIFTIAHPEVVLYKEFYSKLGHALGVSPRFIFLPYWAVSSALSLAATFGLTLPISKENLLGLKAMKAIDSKQDSEKLGISLCSLSEALQRLSDQRAEKRTLL